MSLAHKPLLCIAFPTLWSTASSAGFQDGNFLGQIHSWLLFQAHVSVRVTLGVFQNISNVCSRVPVVQSIVFSPFRGSWISELFSVTSYFEVANCLSNVSFPFVILLSRGYSIVCLNIYSASFLGFFPFRTNEGVLQLAKNGCLSSFFFLLYRLLLIHPESSSKSQLWGFPMKDKHT